MKIEITEIKNKEDGKRLGNLGHTFRAQLQNAVGNHSDVHISMVYPRLPMGTLKTTSGNYYDWWICEDGTLLIEEAQ